MLNKKKSEFKVNPFQIVSIICSLTFIYLFITLLFDAETFIKDLGLEPGTAAIILTRRASVFMLGIAVLTGLSSVLPHSKARQFICLSLGITLLGLATNGCFELSRGSVNNSMWQAIVIETILGVSYMLTFLLNKFSKTKQY